MIELKGKYNKVKIFASTVEQTVYQQINDFMNLKAFEDYNLALMADNHSGKGCVVGFTAKNINRVSPNILGVDLSCGVLALNLGKIEIDLKAMDEFIRNKVPHGQSVNEKTDKTFLNKIVFEKDIKEICEKIGDLKSSDRHLQAIGSLGGGNHYIELNEDSKGNKWLVVHSGSRNFGHKIATFYQDQAQIYCKQKNKEFVDEVNKKIGLLKKEGKETELEKTLKGNINIYNVPKELSFVEGELLEEYLRATKVANDYAFANRLTILNKIITFLGINKNILSLEKIHTIHNYFEKTTDGNYIRKGAVSAKKDELVIIPINMRDGSIIAKGKGNLETNSSAPHGAGRLMSRKQAKEDLEMDEFRETMKNVYSTSVKESTLDEAPMAYKPMSEIIENTKETIDVLEIIKPLYNFKA